MLTSELKPVYTRQKSFYRKAEINDNPLFEWIYLYSYGTLVASYNRNTKEFRYLWKDWSKTTAIHVNELRQQLGLEPWNKKEMLANIYKKK